VDFEGLQLRRQAPPPLAHKLLLAVRSMSLYSLLASLVSLEISHLYFGGHTIFGALLAALAGRLSRQYVSTTPPSTTIPAAATAVATVAPLAIGAAMQLAAPWRLRVARRLLVMSLWWEKLWLTKKHVLLIGVYEQLVAVLKAMHDSESMKRYASALQLLKTRERRKKLIESAQKTLEVLKAVRGRIVQWHQRGAVTGSVQAAKTFIEQRLPHPWR